MSEKNNQTDTDSLNSLVRTFGPLGWTAFGGPVAHLGYFRTEFVARRGWLSEQAFSDLVAISQFLPGPASSKVGQAIGYHRAGFAGMVLSWVLFTAPSALILAVCGLALSNAAIDISGQGWIKGLLAAAVAVVIHALTGMARKLLTTPVAWVMAAVACAVLIFFTFPLRHVVVIAAAGAIGLSVARGRLGQRDLPGSTTLGGLRPVSARTAWICLGLFFGLLAGLWVAAQLAGGYFWSRLNAFYQAGALVFGGGHVVLPLLEEQFVTTGWLTQSEFITGYSLAQAVPGPLFTFAAYLGAVDGGIAGALLGTVVIFIPGTLLMLAGLHFWAKWQQSHALREAFAGINAAVVGILAAALWDPIITHGITGWISAIIALACWAGIALAKAPAWVIAASAALAGFVVL